MQQMVKKQAEQYQRESKIHYPRGKNWSHTKRQWNALMAWKGMWTVTMLRIDWVFSDCLNSPVCMGGINIRESHLVSINYCHVINFCLSFFVSWKTWKIVLLTVFARCWYSTVKCTTPEFGYSLQLSNLLLHLVERCTIARG